MSENQQQGKFCAECGTPAADRQQFCRQCGFQFPPEDLDEERNLRVALPGESGPSCLSGIFKVVGFFILICVIVPIVASLSHMKRYRGNAQLSREKACYANMRVLLGAIEMYNMDNSVMLKTADDSAEQRLIADKFLKAPLSKPEPGCRYTSTGDLTGAGKVKCDVHGTVE